MDNLSNFTTSISLNNQPSITRPTLMSLNPEKCTHRLHYCLFMVNWDRCCESCNTLDDPSHWTCAPNKTEDYNSGAFKMIAKINKSASLT